MDRNAKIYRVILAIRLLEKKRGTKVEGAKIYKVLGKMAATDLSVAVRWGYVDRVEKKQPPSETKVYFCINYTYLSDHPLGGRNSDYMMVHSNIAASIVNEAKGKIKKERVIEILMGPPYHHTEDEAKIIFRSEREAKRIKVNRQGFVTAVSPKQNPKKAALPSRKKIAEVIPVEVMDEIKLVPDVGKVPCIVNALEVIEYDPYQTQVVEALMYAGIRNREEAVRIVNSSASKQLQYVTRSGRGDYAVLSSGPKGYKGRGKVSPLDHILTLMEKAQLPEVEEEADVGEITISEPVVGSDFFMMEIGNDGSTNLKIFPFSEKLKGKSLTFSISDDENAPGGVTMGVKVKKKN